MHAPSFPSNVAANASPLLLLLSLLALAAGPAFGQIAPDAPDTAGEAARDTLFHEQPSVGVQTVISAEQMAALPVLPRSLAGLARLAPHYGGGFGDLRSRRHAVRMGGVLAPLGFGLPGAFYLNGSVPGGLSGPSPLSLETIRTFAVQTAPYDVRHGGFTGRLLQATPRRGTNSFKGSARYLARSGEFTGDLKGLGAGNYAEQYFTAHLGGPIIKDRLFFFAGGEMVLQNRLTSGAEAPPQAPDAFALPLALLDRYGYESTEAALQAGRAVADSVYGYDAGSLQPVTRQQDHGILFARLDGQIAPGHRLMLHHRYAHATGDRGAVRSPLRFDLGPPHVVESTLNSSTMQLNSTLGSNMYNEARLAYTRLRNARRAEASFPEVEIAFPQARRAISLGAGRLRWSNDLAQDLVELANTFTYRRGAHTLTLGAGGTRGRLRRLAAPHSGAYTYAPFMLEDGTLTDPVEAFRRGQPVRYRYTAETTGAGASENTVSAYRFGIYAQDVWQALEDLHLRFGLRADRPYLPQEPAFDPAVQETFGARAAGGGGGRMLWSPRFGSSYRIGGGASGSTHLRGGIGVFPGRLPLGWMAGRQALPGVPRLDARFHPAEDFYGPGAGAEGRRFMPRASERPPDPPPATPEVHLVSEGFTAPQILRTSLAVDQALPGGLTFTLEGLYASEIHGIGYEHLNLAQIDPGAPEALYPLAASAYGRPLYGIPARRGRRPNRVSEQFADVLLLKNTGAGYRYGLTAQLQRRVEKGLRGSLSYTLADARSTGSGLAFRAHMPSDPIFDTGDPALERSGGVVRHRVLAYGSYRFGWDGLFEGAERFATSVGLIFESRPGAPFSWVYHGDANGDGMNTNDLVYIPETRRDVLLTTQNWEALDAFIKSQPALREARGEAIPRNSAAAPRRTRLDLQLTQQITTFGTQILAFELTFANVLNMLRDDWGRLRTVPFGRQRAWDFEGYVTPAEVGRRVAGRLVTEDDLGKPVIRFDQNALEDQLTGHRYRLRDLASRWQLHIGVRYAF